MSKYTREQLDAQYQKLPDNLKEAIFGVDVADHMWDIGKKFGITIERTGQLAEEAGYLILGLTHPKDFIPSIQERLDLDDEEAAEIGKEINEQVFMPIRQALKQTHDLDLDPIDAEIRRRLANYEELSGTKLADIFPRPESPVPPRQAPSTIIPTPEKPKEQKTEAPIRKDFSFSDLAKMPSTVQSPLEKKITDIQKPPPQPFQQPALPQTPHFPDPDKLRPTSGRAPFIPPAVPPSQTQAPAASEFSKVPPPTESRPARIFSDVKIIPPPPPPSSAPQNRIQPEPPRTVSETKLPQTTTGEHQTKDLQDKISNILSELPASAPKSEEKKISFGFPEEISAPKKEAPKVEGIVAKPVLVEKKAETVAPAKKSDLEEKKISATLPITAVKVPPEKPEHIGGVLMSAPIAKKDPVLQTAVTKPIPAIKPAPAEPIPSQQSPYKSTDPYREPID